MSIRSRFHHKVCSPLLVTLLLSLVFAPASGRQGGPAITSDETIPGRFVVKLSSRADMNAIAQSVDADAAITRLPPALTLSGVAEPAGISRLYVYRTTDPDKTIDMVRAEIGASNIEYIEPDYRLELFDYPTDPLFAQQWGLRNTGQEYYGVLRKAGLNNDSLVLKSGVAGADLNLDPLYQAGPADTGKVVVAIIDSGTDLDHPELAGRFWVNEDEIPGNGLDDDHNGYVDDTLGYDLSGDNPDFFNLQPDNDPTDIEGHGTHVTGIVAANADGIGVVGVAPWVAVMPVKIYPNASSSIGASAIIYSVIAGARVINISWGTPYESLILQEALDFARANGVFVAIASGNSGTDQPFYPAASDSAFAVGAGNSSGFVTSFSSYGPHLDIVAPGEDILSLRAAGTDIYAQAGEPGAHIIDSIYYLSDGTSMAAPMVAGAAAYLWSVRPFVSLQELEQVLRQGATDLVDPLDRGDTLVGFDRVSGYGYIDLNASYQLITGGGLAMLTPESRVRVTDSVAIKVAPLVGYAGGYELYFAIGNTATTWQLLTGDVSLPTDSVIYTFTPADGNGVIRLRLVDDNGRETIRTFVMSAGRTLTIHKPTESEQLAYTVPVTATAQGADYDSLILSYRAPGGATEVLFTSTAEHFDSLMYTWSLSGVTAGDYQLVLEGRFGAESLIDSVSITILNSFAEGWPQLLPGRAAISPVTADLTGDGFKEIICGTIEGLYVYRYDGTPLAGFPVRTGEDMRCVPAVYDIDHDNQPEIVTVGEQGLFAFNPDGSTVAGWPRLFDPGQAIAFGFATPTISQLGGSVPDSAVVLVDHTGEIRAYRFDGTPYFYSLGGWFADFTSQSATSFYYGGNLVTSADLRGDGIPEVMASYSANAPYAGIGLFDNRTGQPAFERVAPDVVRASAVHGSLLVDLSGDGLPEIVSSGYDSTGLETIWARTLGTEPLPGWPVTLPDLTDWLSSQPMAADLDLDGSPEIICTFFEFDIGGVYIFRADGTPYVSREGRPAGEAFFYPATFGVPVVADLLGDAYPEIAFRSGYILPTTGPERLFLLDHLGNLLPGWPVETPNRPHSTFSSTFAPLVDDIDNDQLVELLLFGDDNNVLVYNFNASYDNGENYARINADNLNSGHFTFEQIPTDIGDDDELLLPADLTLYANYPNPFNPSTVIEFSLPRQSEVSLRVFNVLGQQVATLVDEELPAGNHAVTFDGSAVATGVYFYRLTTDSRTLSRKMVLVK